MWRRSYRKPDCSQTGLCLLDSLQFVHPNLCTFKNHRKIELCFLFPLCKLQQVSYCVGSHLQLLQAAREWYVAKLLGNIGTGLVGWFSMARGAESRLLALG